MGKKINVMLNDDVVGLFETDFEEEQGQELFIREYNSGNVLVVNQKGFTLAEFKANEWVAYAVQKEVEEDGENEDDNGEG